MYRWLAQTRVGPLVELPFSGEGADFRYLLGSTTHHVIREAGCPVLTIRA